MKYFVLCCLVLLAPISLAQQGQAPSTSNPPYQTPPTLPESRRRSMPPDSQAPPPQQLSSEQVQARISERLRTEQSLSEDQINTEVNDDAVVLKGSVANMAQHDLAVQIAQSYAGNRKVEDHLEVKQRT